MWVSFFSQILELMKYTKFECHFWSGLPHLHKVLLPFRHFRASSLPGNKIYISFLFPSCTIYRFKLPILSWIQMIYSELKPVVWWWNFPYPNSDNWTKTLPRSTPWSRVDLIFSIPLSLCGLWKHTPTSGPVASIWCPKVHNSKQSRNSLLK